MVKITRALAIVLVIFGWLLAIGPAARAAGPQPPEGGGQVIHLTGAADRANTLAYSSDGRWLAVGTTLGIYLYDAHSLNEMRFIPTPTWVRSLAFSPDGELLATGSYEASVRL
ncbi:MAG: hypothetical protein ABI847_02145, partial [Anaerolineales bacterium]